MTRRLVVSPRALDDLLDLATYIAQDDPAAAARVVDQLRTRSEYLLQFPRLGRPYPRRQARGLSAGRYLILYRETPDGITILRYYHTRRDPAGL